MTPEEAVRKLLDDDRDTCDRINGVWSKCGQRVEPWKAAYKWSDADCEWCRAHPDYGIAVAKKRNSRVET